MQKFAEATDAHEWIHVDVERARKESPFGSTVVHGYLTLALATPFVHELLDLGGSAFGVNYGINRVRFPAPITVGQCVRAHGVLKSVQRKGSAAQTAVELTYETAKKEKSPCIAEVLALVLPAEG